MRLSRQAACGAPPQRSSCAPQLPRPLQRRHGTLIDTRAKATHAHDAIEARRGAGFNHLQGGQVRPPAASAAARGPAAAKGEGLLRTEREQRAEHGRSVHAHSCPHRGRCARSSNSERRAGGREGVPPPEETWPVSAGYQRARR